MKYYTYRIWPKKGGQGSDSCAEIWSRREPNEAKLPFTMRSWLEEAQPVWLKQRREPSERPGWKVSWRRLCEWVIVTLSCLILCDPMDCSLPGSSVHGIPQARTLEWVAISFSRGSSPPRDQTQASHIAGRFFTIWATREAFKEH